MSENLVKVVVTNKNAVYVNDMRITNRSTKWGVHSTRDEFKCGYSEIEKKLIERGHKEIIKLIDIDISKGNKR